jgi:hypothetical protein
MVKWVFFVFNPGVSITAKIHVVRDFRHGLCPDAQVMPESGYP